MWLYLNNGFAQLDGNIDAEKIEYTQGNERTQEGK